MQTEAERYRVTRSTLRSIQNGQRAMEGTSRGLSSYRIACLAWQVVDGQIELRAALNQIDAAVSGQVTA